MTHNQDLEELEALLQAFNVFEALGIVYNETRHSNFLAWLLDPKATHGMGSYFLKGFLFTTYNLGQEQGTPTLSAIDVDTWDLTRTSVARESSNIDLLILNEDADKKFAVMLENKAPRAPSRGSRTVLEE